MVSERSEHDVASRSVATEIEAVSALARAAYLRRDVDAFMATFHPALAYTQLDGRTIGHEQLARDVRDQLARMDTATSEFRQSALEVRDAETATQTVEQRGTFAVRAFGFLRREWTVSRSIRYEWVRTESTWQVRRAEILREELVSKFSIGLA
jgi:hypothetical protein